MSEVKKDAPKFRIKYSINAPTKDEYVLEDVYSEYYDSIFRTAYGYTKDYHDAEDVTQEIFLRILYKWKYFDGKQLAQFISTQASQAHIDWFKANRWEKDFRSYDAMFLPDADWNHPESNECDPLLIMLRDATGDCLRHKLSQLKPMDYDLFRMVYIDGYKASEAAMEVGINKSNVDIRLFRVRQYMSSCITRDDILE